MIQTGARRNEVIGAHPDQEAGRLLAAVLAGCWRPSPPPLVLREEQLAEVAPMAIASNTGALLWRRVRETPLAHSPLAAQLLQAYRFSALQSHFRERRVETVFRLMGAHGVEPLIVKGWGLSRQYPEKALRTYDDIDLCVRPEDYAAADSIVKAPASPAYLVDLHQGFRYMDDRSTGDLFHRSETAELEGVQLRLLGPEDQLRLACLHFLHHGGDSPLTLCDVGLLLESLPSEFDWEYFLSGDRRRSEWARCGLALCSALLGAGLGLVPQHIRSFDLPRWLIPAVLVHWGKGLREPVLPVRELHRPVVVLRALRERWSSPIEAAFKVGWPGTQPRLFLQVACLLAIISHFALRRGSERLSGGFDGNHAP